MIDNIVSTHLVAFAENFIIFEKSKRYAALARSKKGLKKWMGDLDHFQRNLDKSKVNLIGDKEIQNLASHFKRENEALVFSTLIGLGGVVLPLSVAIMKTYKMGNGSIISMELGKSALYFGEEIGENYILKK
jgi:hypothetical protein